MHDITTHRAPGLNDFIRIQAMNEPGVGNANSEYIAYYAEGKSILIKFQTGPVTKGKPNGLSDEALLAIVADRLINLQNGDFACQENVLALMKIQEAIQLLKDRTEVRAVGGVGGTPTK